MNGCSESKKVTLFFLGGGTKVDRSQAASLTRSYIEYRENQRYGLDYILTEMRQAHLVGYVLFGSFFLLSNAGLVNRYVQFKI